MVTALKQLTAYLAGGIEVAAAIIIGLAAIEAGVRGFPLFVPRTAPLHDDVEIIRLRLGRWLTLAIEFELAADILRTAVTPTWNDIGQLAAIVVLRTVLKLLSSAGSGQSRIPGPSAIKMTPRGC